jgi:hypothetical protein
MFAVAARRCNVQSSVAQTALSPPARGTDDRTALLATILTPLDKPSPELTNLLIRKFKASEEKEWLRGD